MNNPFLDQAMFMTACGQTIIGDNANQSGMYGRLIDEEYEEFGNASSEAELADAVIDMIVVLIGYGLSHGWPMQALWDEVMQSNMAKIDPATGKVRKREDGKVLKPEGWTPPNLEAFLER